MNKIKCQHKGCTKNSDVVCIVPEQDYTLITIVEHLCEEHAYEAGYCTLCGEFWGGIESFDFNNPCHICENCQEEIRNEDFIDYDDEDFQEEW